MKKSLSIQSSSWLNELEAAVLEGQVAKARKLSLNQAKFRLSPATDPGIQFLSKWRLHGGHYELNQFSQFAALHQVLLKQPMLVEQYARLAVIKGEIKALHYLLQFDMDINQIDHNGTTLLHIACQFGHYDLVDLLLAYDAEVNIPDDFNQYPIDIALSHHHQEIVLLLLEHCTDHHVDSIQLCLDNNQMSIMIKLLKTDLSLVPRAVERALQTDHPQALFLLLNTFPDQPIHLTQLLRDQKTISSNCLAILRSCQATQTMKE